MKRKYRDTNRNNQLKIPSNIAEYVSSNVINYLEEYRVSDYVKRLEMMKNNFSNRRNIPHDMEPGVCCMCYEFWYGIWNECMEHDCNNIICDFCYWDEGKQYLDDELPDKLPIACGLCVDDDDDGKEAAQTGSGIPDARGRPGPLREQPCGCPSPHALRRRE